MTAGPEAPQNEAQSALKAMSAQAAAQLLAAKRVRQEKLARVSLIEFVRATMPDRNEPDNPDLSMYTIKEFHRAIAAALEKVEKGKLLRLIITVPPRMGKSELATRRFIPWLMGRDPYRNVIFGTYNQDFAREQGKKIRAVMLHPVYKKLFPKTVLARGEQSADALGTEDGGQVAFVGRGGTTTGRGADIFIVDDPIKDRAEADSVAIREDVWHWWTDVVNTRLMSDTGAIVLIMCMTGDTKVRMGDGTEKNLRDIRRGDVVATYEDGQIATARVLNWVNQGPDSVYAIKTKSGTTVKANERHPFLVDRDGVTQWIKVRDLIVGDRLVRVSPGTGENTVGSLALPRDATSPPAAEDSATRITTDSFGRLGTGPRPLTTNPAAPPECAIDTGLTRPTTSGCVKSRTDGAPFANNPPGGMSARTGAENYVSITATTLELCEGSCATTVISPLDTEKPNLSSGQRPITFDSILQITPAGVEDVFDIQVERTENFIANGLVSHNTRWQEDDIVGRLTDPQNPCFVPEEGNDWHIINLPALAEDGDVLGRKPGEALWPEKFSAEFLLQRQKANPRSFSALYQQRPSPIDGALFKADMITTFKTRDAIPQDKLRIYAASDHAVGTRQENDRTCMLVVGVDREQKMWILDCVWKRMDTEAAVEAMLTLAARWKPIAWYTEKGQIEKSIGPFLRKRSRETKRPILIHTTSVAGDKVTKAQSIIAHMSLGGVMFPSYESWFDMARDELLKFPAARHDDFVDTIGLLGQKLGVQTRGTRIKASEEIKAYPTGTFGWIKMQAEMEKRQQRRNIRWAA